MFSASTHSKMTLSHSLAKAQSNRLVDHVDDVDHRIKQQVYLTFTVAAALRMKGCASHFDDIKPPAVLEIPSNAVSQSIDFASSISSGEHAHPCESITCRSRQPVEHLLRYFTLLLHEGFPPDACEESLAFPSRERVLQSLQGIVDVIRQIAALLQRKRRTTNTLGTDYRHLTALRLIGATGILKKVFDLLDAVAVLRPAGLRKRSTHRSIVP